MPRSFQRPGALEQRPLCPPTPPPPGWEASRLAGRGPADHEGLVRPGDSPPRPFSNPLNPRSGLVPCSASPAPPPFPEPGRGRDAHRVRSPSAAVARGVRLRGQAQRLARGARLHPDPPQRAPGTQARAPRPACGSPAPPRRPGRVYAAGRAPGRTPRRRRPRPGPAPEPRLRPAGDARSGPQSGPTCSPWVRPARWKPARSQSRLQALGAGNLTPS